MSVYASVYVCVHVSEYASVSMFICMLVHVCMSVCMCMWETEFDRKITLYGASLNFSVDASRDTSWGLIVKHECKYIKYVK